MTENGKERTEIWEKEQSKVLEDDRKEKGRRRMAYLTLQLEWNELKEVLSSSLCQCNYCPFFRGW